MNKRISLEELKSYLWSSAVLLRTHIDASEYKQYIFPLLFFKRLCDVYDEETQLAIEQYGEDVSAFEEDEIHSFIIPQGYVSRTKVSPQQIIRENDILMCASSGSLEHVGKAAICSPASIDYTFGAFCKVIRTKKDLLPKFLATYFVTDEYRDTIMSLACGTNINNLKNEYIDNLLIPIPEKSIQESFVRMIEQFDKSKSLCELTAQNRRMGGVRCA